MQERMMIQLADISKPRYDESGLTEEFVLERWEEVENTCPWRIDLF